MGHSTIISMRPPKLTQPHRINRKLFLNILTMQFAHVHVISWIIPFSLVQIQFLRHVSVSGNWTEFGDFTNWTTCNVTCGGGYMWRERKRNCTNPQQADGGQNCPGSDTDRETKICNTSPCPGNYFASFYLINCCKFCYSFMICNVSIKHITI
jgi:hypothetical protein